MYTLLFIVIHSICFAKTNSPDLNPLDYFFWDEVAQRLTQKKFSNRNELINKIKETVNEIPLNLIRDAIVEFRSRIYSVEKNN